MNILKPILITSLAVTFLAPPVLGKKAKKKARHAASEAAKTSTLRLELVDTTLSTVPFGKDLKGTIAWIRSRIERSYEPRLKSALDVRERDKLMHRMQQEVGVLSNQVIHFKGQATGFEASVVQDEFAPGVDESLLLFRDGRVDHYLFFSEGALWKYARPLRPTDSFAILVQTWTGEQGKPSALEEQAGVVTSATWTGTQHTMRIEDRRLVTASDLLVLELRVAAEAVATRRKTAKAAEGGASASDDLESFIE